MFVLPLQKFDGVNSKIKHPPSSRVSPTAVPPLHTLREPTASALRGATLSARIDMDISFLMSLRFVRQLRTQTAQSLVLSVKLGVRFLAAVAARVPSSKLLQLIQLNCAKSMDNAKETPERQP